MLAQIVAAYIAGVESLPLPEKWQLSIAAFWAANMIAVAFPGRYDGQSAAQKEKDTRSTELTANLFTPAGWAFAIWGPIFLGEFLMMLVLTTASTSSSGSTLATVGRAVAPGWCAGTLAQILWCVTFRPGVCGPSQLWLPAVLLAVTGGGLGVAHRALRSIGALADTPGHARGRQLPALADAFVRWPIVLHLGWISAASLVNLNNYLARRGSSVALKAVAAKTSVAVALALAAYVYATTEDALVGFVVCWALTAVASDGAKAARGLVDDLVLDQVRSVVTKGAVLAGLGLLLKIGQ